jgi:hypothetical protein
MPLQFLTQYLSALNFGFSGLAAILFLATVGILQAEQKRKVVRPEMLATLKVVMAFGAILVVVPGGVEVFHQIWDTNTGNYKTAIQTQVNALSNAENLKVAALLNDLAPGSTKTDLIRFASGVCQATTELKKTTGQGNESTECKHVDEIATALPQQ